LIVRFNMINKKEISYIIIAVFLIALIMVLEKLSLKNYLWALLMAAVMILFHVAGYKILAWRFGSKAEIKFWEVSRFGFRPQYTFRTPVPLWLLFPLFLVIISSGVIKWFSIFSVNIKGTARRAKYRWMREKEIDTAVVASGGALFSLILATISYSLGFREFALYNGWFAVLTILPLGVIGILLATLVRSDTVLMGDYPGTKIFFNSLMYFTFFLVMTIAMLIMMYLKLNIILIIIAAILLGFVIMVSFMDKIMKGTGYYW